MAHLENFAQLLIWAMDGRGTMSNPAIYRELKATAKEHGRTLPPNWESEVRQTLQAHCPTAKQYRGGPDYFEHRGRGQWSCKVSSPSLSSFAL